MELGSWEGGLLSSILLPEWFWSSMTLLFRGYLGALSSAIQINKPTEELLEF
jgi:hypothetical protein